MAAKTSSYRKWQSDFWSDFPGDESLRRWASTYNDQDRRVFELEVEAMVADLVPDDLGRLRQSYDRCDWSTKPRNAVCDLHEALLTAGYLKDILESSDVVSQLTYGKFELATEADIDSGSLINARAG